MEKNEVIQCNFVHHKWNNMNEKHGERTKVGKSWKCFSKCCNILPKTFEKLINQCSIHLWTLIDETVHWRRMQNTINSGMSKMSLWISTSKASELLAMVLKGAYTWSMIIIWKKKKVQQNIWKWKRILENFQFQTEVYLESIILRNNQLKILFQTREKWKGDFLGLTI